MHIDLLVHHRCVCYESCYCGVIMSKRSAHGVGGPLPAKKKPFSGQGLEHSMNDPALLVYSDDRIAIIKDKYPKARHHFLVMPKEENISNLMALRGRHMDLLKYMQSKGEEQAKSHLHLHVISQDFDSPCLKTKKHWNSFTTHHFVDSSEVIRQLEENGRFFGISSEESKQLLNSDLRCHKCDDKFTTMPKLKAHIGQHVTKNITNE